MTPFPPGRTNALSPYSPESAGSVDANVPILKLAYAP